jgi:hypothetical protein
VEAPGSADLSALAVAVICSCSPTRNINALQLS